MVFPAANSQCLDHLCNFRSSSVSRERPGGVPRQFTDSICGACRRDGFAESRVRQIDPPAGRLFSAQSHGEADLRGDQRRRARAHRAVRIRGGFISKRVCPGGVLPRSPANKLEDGAGLGGADSPDRVAGGKTGEKNPAIGGEQPGTSGGAEPDPASTRATKSGCSA